MHTDVHSMKFFLSHSSFFSVATKPLHRSTTCLSLSLATLWKRLTLGRYSQHDMLVLGIQTRVGTPDSECGGVKSPRSSYTGLHPVAVASPTVGVSDTELLFAARRGDRDQRAGPGGTSVSKKMVHN